MLHYGIRNVEALPARPARAQAQVGVFAVEEEILVESADIFQHRAAVERRGSGWQEGFLLHREIFRHAAVAALLADPSRATSMPAESRLGSPKRRTCDAHMPMSGRGSIAFTSVSSQRESAAASSLSAAT